MLSRRCPRLALAAAVALAAGAAGAATPPVVFHSPNDDGTPHPVTFQLGGPGLHTLRLYLETGPSPSPGGPVVCLDAPGDEICAWHLDIETTGAIAIDSFTPDPALASSFRWSLESPTLLRVNRVNAAGGGDLGALRIGELVVDHLGPGEVRLWDGSHAASAGLLRLPVEGNPIAVPEPGAYPLLGTGVACLALLGRLRRAWCVRGRGRGAARARLDPGFRHRETGRARPGGPARCGAPRRPGRSGGREMTTGGSTFGTLLGAALLALAVPAAAEEVPFVDGRDWKESAPVLKRAYLIGISNLLSAEYAYQEKFGPPPDRQTAIRRIYEGVDEASLDGVIGRIDAWYRAHPDREDTPVLGVVWIDLVEPNLPASRRYAGEGDESEEKR